jgi:hypothetical protein
MATLISLIIGLALGTILGILIVQYVFNDGKRPTTRIENEEEVESKIKAARSEDSIEFEINS